MSINPSIPDYQLADRIVVTAPAQLRAMADPLRVTILDLLLERAATGKWFARFLTGNRPAWDGMALFSRLHRVRRDTETDPAAVDHNFFLDRFVQGFTLGAVKG